MFPIRQNTVRTQTGYINVRVAMTRREWIDFCDFAENHGMRIMVATEAAVRWWFALPRQQQAEWLTKSRYFDHANKLTYFPKPGMNTDIWQALCRLEYPYTTNNALLRAVLRGFVQADAATIEQFRNDTYMGTSLEYVPGIVT